MKNFGLKVLSVLIALGLVTFVHSKTNSSVLTLSVPVEIRKLPADKMILLPFPSDRRAQVTVQGPSYLVSRVAGSSLRFGLEAPSDADNRFKVALNRKYLAIPPAIKEVIIDPPEMEFTLDDRVTNVIPVVIQKIGRVADPLKLEEVNISPSTIEITGPRTEISSIRSIETYPVDLRNLQRTTTQEIELRVPGRYTNLSTNSVTVEFIVNELRAERLFEKTKIEVRAAPGKAFNVSPDTVSIELSGPRDLVSKLTNRDVVPYVRLRESTTNGELVAVSVDLPEKVEIVYLDPVKVKVTAK